MLSWMPAQTVCCVSWCMQAWPSTLRTVYGDHERYETNYFKPFPGYYFSGRV